MASTLTTPNSQVAIRRARLSDIWPSAVCFGKAFYHDSLFGHYIHPHRDKYPDDLALFFYRGMLPEYFDWSVVILVAVETDETTGKDVIVGVAQWHRYGQSGKSNGWGLRPWDPRNLLSPIATSYTTIHSHIYPNRAINPSEIDIFDRVMPFTSHLWSTHRAERWDLHLLGTHPDHQGKGIGRRLASWGIEQARREGIGASVFSAYEKDKFYQKCGFTQLLGRAGDGEGNPIAEVGGGNVWWMKAAGEVDGEDGTGKDVIGDQDDKGR